MERNVHNLRVEAVVLRHQDWAEADRLIWLYSREAGKLRAIAKGVRKLRSRKAGHLEPFTRVTLMLARGRDLWIVTQAETVEAYLALHDDLLKTGQAAYIIELLDRFTYEESDNAGLYRLLTETLGRVAEDGDPWLAMRYYEVQLLDVLGYRPELTHCVEGDEEIKPEDQFFSAGQGGILCPRCAPKVAGARPVSVQALKYLRHLQRSAYLEAQRAHPAPPVMQEMEALLQYYITYLLERGLNTPEFIRSVQ